MIQAVAPSVRPLDATILDIFESARCDRSGEVATYIPELATADPEWLGLCLSTTDGTLYRVGDTEIPFTIQSISKPFAYAMAMEHCGVAEVSRRVGVEPSGEAFNSISLEPGSGRPLNPMINAGAIAVSSLIYQRYREESLSRMLEWFGGFVGRTVDIDQRVYRSESATGHRNRAIAHLLRNFGIVGDPVEAGVDLYFQQCAILVTAEDLAVMGATLANRGVNPRTGRRALAPEFVDDMLSLMTTCGMYDYAGQWLYDVGLPAKSGVAGGILAMLPGRMGIGTFSPRLDAHGNSVRGVRLCKMLSDRFRLHLFTAGRPARSVIRRRSTLEHRHSQRVRPMGEVARLRREGSVVRVFEVQGDVEFDGMEALQREVIEASAAASHLVLDFARVGFMDSVAVEGVATMILHLVAMGRQVALCSRVPEALAMIDRPGVMCFGDLDEAIECCEDSLLLGAPMAELTAMTPAELSPGEMEIAHGMTAEQVEAFAGYLRRMEYPAGSRLCATGEAAGEVFLLARGLVTVKREVEPGRWQTLARIGAGSAFGEVAIIDRGVRSSDVWASSEVVCHGLSLEDYDRMHRQRPDVGVAVLSYFVKVLTARLRRANEQIAALAM